MCTLSIIVPVYKVEQYLPRCLDSILAQTFTDFELILIDDGSPDNCGVIMEEYASRDSRIITIHQENKGVSAARNAGLRIAKGKYIGFVDSDDWIDPEFYERMITAGEAEKAEVICSPIIRYEESGKQTKTPLPYPLDHDCVLSISEFLTHVFHYPRSLYGSSWNKLFLKSIITEPFREEMKYCEDYQFILDSCRNAKKCAYVNYYGYYYFQRSSSATHADVVRGALLSLVGRRSLVDDGFFFGTDVGFAAEDDYLDAALISCSLSKSKKNAWYYQARRALYTYIVSYWRRVLKNKHIPLKKKVLIFLSFFRSIPAGRSGMPEKKTTS